MAYHKNKIIKGTYGNVSKIQEELDELTDAIQQNVTILIHCELSDLYGALEGVAKRYGLSMNDLRRMSDLTRESFKDGTRHARRI